MIEKQNQPVRLLVADDEESTRTAVSRALELLGYQVSSAANGREVFEQLERQPFDVLLLDLRMPEVNGVEVLEYIRKKGLELAVIVLTAHATLDSAIAALKAGAVDYLLKPKKIAEINEAILSALRRRSLSPDRQHLIGIMEEALQSLKTAPASIPLAAGSSGSQVSAGARFILDIEKRRLVLFGRSVELTAAQAAILSYMISRPDKVLTSREIASNALGYQELSEKEAESVVRPHILRLRKRIEPDAGHPHIVQTIRGSGYLFSPPRD